MVDVSTRFYLKNNNLQEMKSNDKLNYLKIIQLLLAKEFLFKKTQRKKKVKIQKRKVKYIKKKKNTMFVHKI